MFWSVFFFFFFCVCVCVCVCFGCGLDNSMTVVNIYHIANKKCLS